MRGTARIVGGAVQLLFEDPPDPRKQPGATTPPTHRGIHCSKDFTVVRWGSETFSFSGKQRSVVAALMRAREDAYECLMQAELLALAESDCSRLRDLFKGHPAWGTMIVSAHTLGGPLGGFVIVDPPG